jgi:hypothetical protein
MIWVMGTPPVDKMVSMDPGEIMMEVGSGWITLSDFYYILNQIYSVVLI